jgi:hypothetical protein
VHEHQVSTSCRKQFEEIRKCYIYGWAGINVNIVFEMQSMLEVWPASFFLFICLFFLSFGSVVCYFRRINVLGLLVYSNAKSSVSASKAIRTQKSPLLLHENLAGRLELNRL